MSKSSITKNDSLADRFKKPNFTRNSIKTPAEARNTLHSLDDAFAERKQYGNKNGLCDKSVRQGTWGTGLISPIPAVAGESQYLFYATLRSLFVVP
jgi:hypothetical protein